MLKCNSDLFRSSVKLVDSFVVNTKESLKEMANIIGLSIPSKLRKGEYASLLAEAILSCPDKWLCQLTHNELTLLQELVEAGPDTYVETTNIMMGNTLECLSLILSDREKDIARVRYMICDELREAVAPYLDKIQISEEQRVRFMVEQYACGILNLYGYLSYVELLDLLNEYLHGSVTRNEIIKALSDSALIRRLTFTVMDVYDSTLSVQSPYLFDFEDLDWQLSEHPEITGKKRYSKEEVFLAGAMPLAHMPNAYRNELKLFMMQKLKHTEELAEFSLQHLWFVAQTESNSMSVITSIIGGKLSSRHELQEAIELFVNYCNGCPRWFLRGYSSEEVFSLFEKDRLRQNPPRIVPGPNMKAAGMDITPEVQSEFDFLFREVFGEQKVGRNDPCPCGSGVKYKKCCGKGN